MRRPQVDGAEQRASDGERGLVEDAPIVVAGIAVAHGQVSEAIIGLVAWSLGWVRLIEVEAFVGRQRTFGDDHLTQVTVPDRGVVEFRFPRMHDDRKADVGRVPLLGEIAVLQRQLGFDA